jgi:DNA-binding NarL/FixJ family response regulator
MAACQPTIVTARGWVAADADPALTIAVANAIGARTRASVLILLKANSPSFSSLLCLNARLPPRSTHRLADLRQRRRIRGTEPLCEDRCINSAARKTDGRGRRLGDVGAHPGAPPDWHEISTAAPLVGRNEELDLIRRLRNARPPRSTVINGAAGVGKSRLARASLEEAASEGWATLEVRASVGYSRVPFGPMRTILPMSDSTDVELPALVDQIERELAARRSQRGLVLVVEDAHELDGASAGLIHQLVATRSVVALVTTRARGTPPVAINDLWKDGYADRIELRELSRRETATLLEHLLGGPCAESSADRIWHVTDGNPLYVREVVLASIDSGALRLVDGTWRWHGDWASGARLRELVAMRLEGLDPDELTIVEMLSVGGPLSLDLLIGPTSAAALESLETHGIVRLERSGRRIEVTIEHAIHAEVTRSQMTALRQRAVTRNLVEAITRTGMRRNEDRIRLASWSLQCGLEVDLVTLALASEASLFQIGDAIAARLHEIIGAAPLENNRKAPAVQVDTALAVRLARAAYERTGGVAESAALANALGWTGAADEAESVLDESASRISTDEDRVRLAIARGWIRFWGHYDVAGSEAHLREAIAIGDGCDRELVADAFQQLAGIALNTGDAVRAKTLAEETARFLGRDLSETIAAPVGAASLAYLGRCAESLDLIDKALAVSGRGESPHPLTVATLLFTRANTLARAGRLEEGRIIAESCRDVALGAGSPEGTALFGVLVGEILLWQGRPASAARVLRDSSALLAECDIFGYRPWALAALARARALTGDVDAAGTRLAQAISIQPISRHFDLSRYLAEMELASLAGEPDARLAAAEAGIEWALQGGLVLEEAVLLDGVVRQTRGSAAAERLAVIAESADSPLLHSLARHAAALAADDAAGLLEASESFAAMGAWWFAAEAAAAAALLHKERQVTRAAQAASRSALEMAARCEGARATFVAQLSMPGSLSRREAEIATLAARGRSSREIADRLFLSKRTVESHLHHVYIKLGVSDRQSLASILGIAAT